MSSSRKRRREEEEEEEEEEENNMNRLKAKWNDILTNELNHFGTGYVSLHEERLNNRQKCQVCQTRGNDTVHECRVGLAPYKAIDGLPDWGFQRMLWVAHYFCKACMPAIRRCMDQWRKQHHPPITTRAILTCLQQLRPIFPEDIRFVVLEYLVI
jgi:hypothetical protein